MVASIGVVKSAAHASTYFDKDNYYGRGDSPSVWHGKGADALGLVGAVDRKDFQRVLEGRLVDGVELGRIRDGEREHRAGWDVTFSAPKSVSLMAEVAGDDRLVRAHDEAVRATLAKLERELILTRVKAHGTTSLEATGNMVAALFRHDMSREKDPQLHTHAVIANATRRADGRWQSLETKPLFRHAKELGQTYQAELAVRVRELGYAIEPGKHGTFEIRGVPEALKDTLSTRGRQIEERLAEQGLDRTTANREQREQAALDTRRAKREPTAEEARQRWNDRAAEHRQQLDALRSRAERQAAQGATPSERSLRRESFADVAVRRAIASLEERHAVFRQTDLDQLAVRFAFGLTTPAAIGRAIDRAAEQGRLIAGEGRFPDPVSGVDRTTTAWTTPAMREQETRLLVAERRGRGVVDPLLPSRHVRLVLDRAEQQAAALGHAWNSAQRTAADIVLSSRDRVTALQGHAGTAKTTTVVATYAAAAAARGFAVTAVAPTTTAARTLAEQVGAEPKTLQGLLVDLQRERLDAGQGAAPSQGRELWILDEASLAGTRQLRRLVEAAERRDARLLLVGDSAQLGSVEAGRAFAQLQERGMTTAVLDRIVRQTNPQLRAAVYAALDRRAGEALARLDRGGGAIEAVPSTEERLARLADRYASSSPDERARTLVLEPSRDGRRALNAMIRSRLQAQGEFDPDRATMPTLGPKGLTRAESKLASSYLAGDVVRFVRDTRIAPGVRVPESAYLTVASVEAIGNRVTLRRTDGSEILWNPHHGGASAQVFDARTLPLAEGDRIVWTRNDREHGRVNGETATIVAVDPRQGRITVELADGSRQILEARHRPEDRHLDHGYVQTAHKAQGMTAERVLAHLDSNRLNLVNRQSFYVAISRAKTGATVVTDDAAKLRAALAGRSGDVTAALDATPGARELSKLRDTVREQTQEASRPEIAAARPSVRVHHAALTPQRATEQPRDRRQDRDRGL
ncbi:MAG: MobF family relaxase [Pseudomonadota bacterium]